MHMECLFVRLWIKKNVLTQLEKNNEKNYIKKGTKIKQIKYKEIF